MSSVPDFLPTQPTSYSSNILQQMFEQQQNGEFTDFVLSCKDQEIQCHRSVLIISCPYFAKVIRPGKKEAVQGRAVIDNMEHNHLKWIVQFLYGQCEPIVWEGIELLVEACQFLQLTALTKQLDEYIAENINVENCVRWRIIADEKNLYLKEAGKIAEKLITELNFVKLDDCLRCVESKVSLNKDAFLNAGIRWILADVENRKKHMLDVLLRVNVGECSTEAVDEVTDSHSELFAGKEIDLFDIAVTLSNKLPQGDRKQRLFRFGHYDRDCYRSVDNKFPDSQWEYVTQVPMQNFRDYYMLYVLIPSGFVAFGGGRDGKSCYKYDLENSWTPLPDAPLAVRNAVGMYSSGKIRVLCGGDLCNVPDKWILSDDTLSFNLNTRTWSQGPKLREMQFRPIATLYGKSWWVVFSNFRRRNPKTPCSLQLLSHGANEWLYKASLPPNVNTEGGYITAYNNNLYLTGGRRRLCMRYTIDSDQWTELTAKPIEQWIRPTSAFVFQQKIYICGSKGYLNHIQEYDIEANTWNSITHLKWSQVMQFAFAG